MKTRYVILGIAVALMAVPFLYYVSLYFVIAPIKTHAVRQHILNANHQALLVACRQMIANREKYRDDWPDRSWSDKGDRALARDKGEYGEDVPMIIREMDPLYIDISTNRVLVFVYGPPRTGFIGYVKGADELEMLNHNRATMLTNGLWMFTH